jgi:uncharacterized protein (TIGR02145 family)
MKHLLILFVLAVVLGCYNEKGSESSSSRSITPVVDGQVQIGTQIWMTKNLNVSRYRNGDLIPQVSNPTQWANLTTGAWCYYANNSANGLVYGKLYNWYAVNDARGIAPSGWHVPSDAEWTTLVSYLGFADVAGGKLKAIGTLQAGTGVWFNPNASSTNSSGFTALPGGYIADNGSGSFLLTKYGYWWSKTEFGNLRAIARILNYTNGSITNLEYFKDYGFSVRCVKD